MEDKLLSDLFAILKNYLFYFNCLNEHAVPKKNAIIGNNVDEISEIIEKDKKVITRIKNLEEIHSQIISQLCDLYNLNEIQTYSDLIIKFPLKWRGKISLLIVKLGNVTKKIQRQNGENRILLTRSAKINRDFLNMLLETLNIKNTIYDKRQRLSKKNSNHLIDYRG